MPPINRRNEVEPIPPTTEPVGRVTDETHEATFGELQRDLMNELEIRRMIEDQMQVPILSQEALSRARTLISGMSLEEERPKKPIKEGKKEESFVLTIDEDNKNKITLRTLRQINNEKKTTNGKVKEVIKHTSLNWANAVRIGDM